MGRSVIFVPGFLGTEIHWGPPELGIVNRIWLGVRTFAGSGYRQLAIDPAPIQNLGIDTELGGPLLAVYGDFFPWAASRWDEVLYYGWDWRRRLDVSVPGLSGILRSEFAKGNTVSIIAHSAGGKLAARALDGLYPNEIQKVAFVATCGTPWRGSWRSPESLLGWSQSVRIGASLASLGLFTIPRVERFRIQEVLSSFDGLYELFPNEALESELSPPGAPSVWNSASFDGTFQPVNAGKLAEARNHANNVILPPSGTFHYNFVGLGTATPGPFTPGGGFSEVNLNYDQDGDGVVPRASAVLPGAAHRITMSVNDEHGNMTTSQGVLGILQGAL